MGPMGAVQVIYNSSDEVAIWNKIILLLLAIQVLFGL